MGQIFPTACLHRDHLILYALVCEKELSPMGKKNGNPDLVCEKIPSRTPDQDFRCLMLMCNVKMTSPCRISAFSGFSGNLFHVFPI